MFAASNGGLLTAGGHIAALVAKMGCAGTGARKGAAEDEGRAASSCVPSGGDIVLGACLG